MRLLALIFSIIFLSTSIAKATTIRPFVNLGQMAIHTETVVKARVVSNDEVNIGETTRFRSTLEVISMVKGDLEVGELFTVQNYHLKIGDVERTIWGDIEFQEGMTYFLFLAHIDNDLYQTTMLSYAAFEEYTADGRKVLVPFGLGTEDNGHGIAAGVDPEPLGVYKSGKLEGLLKDVITGVRSWDAVSVTSDLKVEDFAEYRMLPDHCATLSGQTYARWEDIETSSLPVYTQEDGDSGCANEITQINNAIANINSNYLGLSLSNGGTHDFAPTCSGQGAAGGEFTSYVSNTYGDGRRHLIQFDDPCSEIADLSGCSGTLAIGGLYWSSATYQYDGTTYRRALYGNVIVNNGVGACECGSSNYEILLIHEITHGLNFGHISAGTGSANMNPSCCNAISTLDKDCVDFLYEPIVLPIELRYFTAKASQKSVQLDWVSSSEINNDYYTIERRNSNGEYEAIKKVQGHKNSNDDQFYSVVDDEAVTGNNIYRLSQTDLEGTTTMLGLVEAMMDTRSFVEVYPNTIIGNEVRLSVGSQKNDLAHYELYAANGNVVTRGTKTIQRGESQIYIKIPTVTTGVYYLHIQVGDRKYVEKLIKS